MPLNVTGTFKVPVTFYEQTYKAVESFVEMPGVYTEFSNTF